MAPSVLPLEIRIKRTGVCPADAAGLRAYSPGSLGKEAVVAEGKNRLDHPRVQSLIAAAVLAIVVVVSLAALIGFLSYAAPVEPTFPGPFDRPFLAMG
jgi:hypothetical protein